MCSRNNQAAKLTERYTRTWRLLTLQRHTIRLDSTSGMAIVGSQQPVRPSGTRTRHVLVLPCYPATSRRLRGGKVVYRVLLLLQLVSSASVRWA